MAAIPRTLDTTTSEDEIRILRAQMKRSDTFCTIFSCLGILFAIIENEMFFNQGNKSSIGTYFLRSLVTVSCFILSSFDSSHLDVFIYKHYDKELEIMKSKKIIFQGSSLYKSRLFKRFVLESIISWIHCPPGVDFIIKNKQLGKEFYISIDAYITVFMLTRLYIFFRLFDHYTFWTDERAARIWYEFNNSVKSMDSSQIPLLPLKHI